MSSYKFNSNADLGFYVSGSTGDGELRYLNDEHISVAMKLFDETIESIVENIPVDIFSILGMRNLSSFVGEVFSRSLSKASNNLLVCNPHQDGYPDLLLLDEVGTVLYKEIEAEYGLQAKSPFSPFEYGGIEIKATCGAVPTPAECKKKNVLKPGIGDQRISLLRSYDWKAHHQGTNNLLGVLWDFICGKPKIVSIFFGNNLNSEDWGKIVQPKDGGGRTTSVSVMTRKGVWKMYKNWVLVIDDNRYINFIDDYNSGVLMWLSS